MLFELWLCVDDGIDGVDDAPPPKLSGVTKSRGLSELLGGVVRAWVLACLL